MLNLSYMENLTNFPVVLIRIWQTTLLLLSAGREGKAPMLLPTRLRWSISIPNHSSHSYDHAQNHMQIETLFSKEKESHNQHKDCLHMAKYLKGHCSKSANAYELAEVRSYCYSTWNNYEHLQWPRIKTAVRENSCKTKVRGTSYNWNYTHPTNTL